MIFSILSIIAPPGRCRFKTGWIQKNPMSKIIVRRIGIEITHLGDTIFPLKLCPREYLIFSDRDDMAYFFEESNGPGKFHMKISGFLPRNRSLKIQF
jgi:hypothetical protein